MTVNRLAFRVVAAAGVTCVGSCAPAENGSPAAPAQPTITVNSVPAAEEGGLYIAAADGYFRQQGLTVKIKSIAGAEEGIPDLQSGKAQLVGGDYVSFVLAQVAGRANAKPASFRVVAPASQTQPGSNALYVCRTTPTRCRWPARRCSGCPIPCSSSASRRTSSSPTRCPP